MDLFTERQDMVKRCIVEIAFWFRRMSFVHFTWMARHWLLQRFYDHITLILVMDIGFCNNSMIILFLFLWWLKGCSIPFVVHCAVLFQKRGRFKLKSGRFKLVCNNQASIPFEFIVSIPFEFIVSYSYAIPEITKLVMAKKKNQQKYNVGIILPLH